MRPTLARTLGLAAGLAFVLAVSLAPASAGVVMQFVNKSPGSEPVQGTVSVETDRLRIDQGGTVAIFRGDKDLMWIVDEKKGEYTELTREQMKKIGDAMAGAMAQMQEQMQSMPPEQRAMVEKMMAGKMPAGDGKPSEPLKYTKLGKSETINGFACTGYAASRGSKQVNETWVTDWKQFDIGAKDFRVFEQMAQFIKEGLGPMGKKLSSALAQKYSDGESPDAVPGVPIRIVTETKGGQSVMEIQKVAREQLAASRFEVPAGLKKQELDGMHEETRQGMHPGK